jgi:hypothetical membrane protein
MAVYPNSPLLIHTRPSLRATLALGGIAGPVLFTLLVVLRGLLWPEYSHLRSPISALAAGPYGWVQNVSFIATGALLAICALGLQLVLASRSSSVLGPALLASGGLGLIGAGIFPATDATGAFSREIEHVVAAAIAFLGAALGLVVTSRSLTLAAEWRRYAPYTLATGIGVLLIFLVTFALAAPPEAPLHSWLGLLQRVTVFFWFTCTVVLAIQLWRSSMASSK